MSERMKTFLLAVSVIAVLAVLWWGSMRLMISLMPGYEGPTSREADLACGALDTLAFAQCRMTITGDSLATEHLLDSLQTHPSLDTTTIFRYRCWNATVDTTLDSSPAVIYHLDGLDSCITGVGTI